MNRKKLIIVSSTSLKEAVTRNRLLPFIDLLLERNIEVTLVCPSSESEKNLNSLDNKYVLKEVKLNESKPLNFVLRALKEIKDASLLLRIAKKEEADGYLITIPSMFLTFLSPIILSNEKVFLDIRDLTWEYLSEQNSLNIYSKRLFRFLFKHSVNFNLITAVTNSSEMAYLQNVWRRNCQPYLVSNGIMREQFEKLQSVNLSNNDVLTVTYIGNIGLAQNLETLVMAAHSLPNVNFKIVGSGIEHDKIDKLIKSKNLSNVDLIGRVNWDKVKEYYDNTDILYAQLSDDYSSAMPSKLYEYLSTGKYIVYGGLGQAASKLKEFSHNQVIVPNDPIALSNIIRKIQEESNYDSINLENRNLIKQNYIRENTAKKFINAIVEKL